MALEDENNIKDALLARFEERMPEDFILWNFSPLSPHLWYLQALVYVLVIAFYCRTFRLKEACISGNSGTVGRKPDKGKLFSAPSGKRLLPCFIMREIFSVLWPALFSGWAACLEREKKLWRAVSTKRK